jgi:hypothetical protein
MSLPCTAAAARPGEIADRPPNRAGGTSMLDGEGAILIFGLERSGTSWLAKIFDSHPDVLCRYEPDGPFPGELPSICLDEDRNKYLGSAREYLRELAGRGYLGVGEPLPFLPKSYRDPAAALLRKTVLYGFGALRHAVGVPVWLYRLPFPDFIRPGKRSSVRLVLKSIRLGRARLYAEAWPKCRVVVIVRHPCGQVESQARGAVLGKYGLPGANVALARSPLAESIGLRVDALDQLSPIELMAWRWAFWNQVMLDDFGRTGRGRIVRYEDLAADPQRIARDLCRFAGLPWHPQTERFIEWSTSRDRSDRYFQVMRDPATAAGRWRNALPAEDQDRVLGMAGRAQVGALFPQ